MDDSKPILTAEPLPAPRPAREIGMQVRIPKAAEVVARKLRNQIIRGVLREGATLPQEGELMTQFGVSRPTLREAVRILESEGLISISRGARGGALVHRPDPLVAARYFGFILQANGVTVADVYRARLLVEPPAARLLAEQGDAAAIAELRGMIERSRDAIEDDRAFGTLSAAFFRRLVELAGIQTLALLCGMLDEVLTRYTEMVWVSTAAQSGHASGKRGSLRAKERLLDIIASGNGAEAEEYLRTHMRAVARLLEQWRLAGRVVDLLEQV